MDERNVSVTSALQLLNSLARDLDVMLNDLALDQDNSSPDGTTHSITRVTEDRQHDSSSPDVISDQKLLFQLGVHGNQEDSAVSSCSEPECGPPAAMSQTERLLRTHPVWFLPGLQRAGAEHLLRGRPAGTFLVRQSSKSSVMTLTVRVPAGAGPHVEHYVVNMTQDGKLSLETSEHKFDNVSSLIAYYSSKREQLPVQLQLPASLQRVDSRHQLSSIALLGQEFWTCRLASCPSSEGTGVGGSDHSSPAGSLNKSSPSSSIHQRGGSLSSLSSGGGGGGRPSGRLQRRSSAPSSAVLRSVSRLRAGPVTDRAPVVLNLVPVEECVSAEESRHRPPAGEASVNFPGVVPPRRVESASSLHRPDIALTRLRSPELVSRVSSPTCGDTATTRSASDAAAPRPPLRWSQPSLSSPADLCSGGGRPAGDASEPAVGAEKPVSTAKFQVSSLDGGTIRSEMSVFIGKATGMEQQQIGELPSEENYNYVGKTRSNGKACSPGGGAGEDTDRALSGGRRVRKKRSTHYRESDLLRSPDAYFRSSVADKISDYEDIWASPARETPPNGIPFFFPSSEAVSQASRDTAEALKELAREAAVPSPLYAVPADALRHGQEVLPQGNRRLSSQQNGSSHNQLGASAAAQCEMAEGEDDCQSVSQPDLVAGVQGRTGNSNDRTKGHVHSGPSARSWESVRRHHQSAVTSSGRDVTSYCGRSGDAPAAAGEQRSARPAAPASRTGELARRASAQPARLQSPRRAARHRRGGTRSEQWRLDSSWEFLGHESCDADSETDDDEGPAPPAAERPSTRQSASTEPAPAELSPEEQTRIVHAIIRQSLPQAVPPPDTSVSHASEYDNLRPPAAPRALNHRRRPEPPHSPAGDTDVSKWQSIMRLMSDQVRLRSGQFEGDERPFTDSESFVMVPGDMAEGEKRRDGEEEEGGEGVLERARPCRLVVPAARLPLPHSQQESLYSPPRLNSLRLHRKCQQSGAAIREYVTRLAQDEASTFALCIFNFLRCTREGAETDPHVVMRNMRQFINGMKNYLVKHGEADFQRVVHQERDKLSSTEFLNLDAILEGVLEELLVTPLHPHVSRLWQETTQRTGCTQRLLENFECARGRSASTLGLKPHQTAPSEMVLQSVRLFLDRMQESASPLDKLESLLATVSALFAAAGRSGESLPADDFLPLLLYVLVQCNVTNVEFEADYMWGLLHPVLLNGEAGYYLTMLSSAVHVLKNLLHYLGERTDSAAWVSQGSVGCGGTDTLEGYLRVLIPDEQQGTILSRTLPARPGMIARDVCKMLDHKLRITSPQDYGLFKLINGEETLVGEHESPQKIKRDLSSKGVHCMLAYKRIEAKIAWPTAQL